MNAVHRDQIPLQIVHDPGLTMGRLQFEPNPAWHMAFQVPLALHRLAVVHGEFPGGSNHWATTCGANLAAIVPPRHESSGLTEPIQPRE
jgi:hypothetical protein